MTKKLDSHFVFHNFDIDQRECVCGCERERERQGGGGGGYVCFSIKKLSLHIFRGFLCYTAFERCASPNLSKLLSLHVFTSTCNLYFFLFFLRILFKKNIYSHIVVSNVHTYLTSVKVIVLFLAQVLGTVE